MTLSGTETAYTKDLCYDRLRTYAKAIRHDPQTNSVFRLAQDVFFDLSEGKVSLEDLNTAMDSIEKDLFDERAGYLRDQHMLDSENIWSVLRSKLDQLADRGFDAFKRVIEAPSGGIVFTAHPTFATPRTERVALARQASGMGRPEDVFPASRTDNPGITLREEHEEAQDAIRHAQVSLQTYLKTAMKVAVDRFPENWKSLSFDGPSLASWVAYDLDGRNDITWWTSLGYRLWEKAEQLGRYAKSLEAIDFEPRHAAEKTRLMDQLSRAGSMAREQSDAFFKDLSDPVNLVNAANLLTEESAGRLISLQPVIATLKAIAEESELETARDLVLLASEMAKLGLGPAHIHLRINAAQIQSVIRRDLGLATEDRDLGQVALESLANKIRTSDPVRINFSDLFLEQSTAKRQLMLCAQITKHIDADTPIRFLIAESENPATVLGALFLAHLYGVADNLDISPLFETPQALENGGRFTERLLGVEAFRDYVKTRGQLSIQLGFSDAGRFIGQVAADMAIERIQNQIARSLALALPGTPLLLFNTHGESVGRGGYPGPFDKRLAHVLTQKTISNCAALNIPLRNEVSFQGGDGYLHFATQVLADSAFGAFVDYALFADREEKNDPFYSKNSLVWDFYRSLRQWHETLFDEPNYGLLLSDFAGGFLLDAGSRPKRRDSGPSGPRSLRAISHNATLQQLGILANTACGIGSSLERESDDLVRLIDASPRFRDLIELAVFSRIRTSIPSLRGYAHVYSPSFWVACSKRTDNKKSNARITIAKLLEDGRRQYALMISANRFSVDLGRFDRLLSRLEDAPSVKRRHEARLAIHAAHAIRQGIMMRAFEIAGSLPSISARLGFEIGDVQALILNMRIDEAVENLAKLFPISGDQINEFGDLSEPRSDRSEISPTDYASLHEELLIPLQSMQMMIHRISLALCHAHYAFG